MSSRQENSNNVVSEFERDLGPLTSKSAVDGLSRTSSRDSLFAKGQKQRIKLGRKQTILMASCIAGGEQIIDSQM
jgi:hypothetical protein